MGAPSFSEVWWWSVPSLGTTFKQAEDLLEVVLVQEQPYKIISRVQINEVRQQFLLKLEEKAEADEDAPLRNLGSDTTDFMYRVRMQNPMTG